MFGPIMSFSANGNEITLAPISKDDMPLFIENGGMQRLSVTQYLSYRTAPVLEDEYEWYDRTRQDKSVIVWGIFVGSPAGNTRLIGNTALHIMEGYDYHGAVSGSMIFDPEWWGKGIASYCHRVRTLYAFDYARLQVVRSSTFESNHASRRSLEKVGYVQVSLERNAKFHAGKWHHMQNHELINPDEQLWQQWWHGDSVPQKFVEARTRTHTVMEWARSYVKLL